MIICLAFCSGAYILTLQLAYITHPDWGYGEAVWHTVRGLIVSEELDMLLCGRLT